MQKRVTQLLERSPWFLSLWAITAAFGTYACMYAFRKPFTAASFSDQHVFGWEVKSLLLSSQVTGYLISKLIGIRIIAEMPPERRAIYLVFLVSTSHVALLFFAFLPSPWHIVCIFINGLPLGLVFGLVLGFLEGRRVTELLSAGLCASFILASGVSKGVGTWLLQQGISERWMPFVAGTLFFFPMMLGVWMLTCIPPPSRNDEIHRSRREPMTRAMRYGLIQRYATGLIAIAGVYFLTTILRSLRDDFAPELWLALGAKATPSDFAWTDLWVAMSVLMINGASVFIVDNRKALLVSIGLSMFGMFLILVGLWCQSQGWLSPMLYMIVIGLGLYLPYVAIHTTVFERIMAATRDRGNIGFLMYVADSLGYLGFVGVMFGRQTILEQSNIVEFFSQACLIASLLAIILLGVSGLYFSRVLEKPSQERIST